MGVLFLFYFSAGLAAATLLGFGLVRAIAKDEARYRNALLARKKGLVKTGEKEQRIGNPTAAAVADQPEKNDGSTIRQPAAPTPPAPFTVLYEPEGKHALLKAMLADEVSKGAIKDAYEIMHTVQSYPYASLRRAATDYRKIVVGAVKTGEQSFVSPEKTARYPGVHAIDAVPGFPYRIVLAPYGTERERQDEQTDPDVLPFPTHIRRP